MSAPRYGRQRTVPTELAALAVGVTEATVRKWASRGKITRYGNAGQAEYSIDELMTLAETRLAYPGSDLGDDHQHSR